MLRVSSRTIPLALAASVFCGSCFAADVYDREGARLAQLMNWQPGQTIAEIGAGEGEMSFYAASKVGPNGKVYTTELDDKKLAHLKEEVSDRKLQNVEVVKAGPVDTDLPDGCCNDIFMRRVYHHFKDPAQTDAAIFRDLKPGGLLAVIDFPPRPGLPPIEGAPKTHGTGHGIAKSMLIRELKSVGFEIVEQSPNWPEGDYCVIARKPERPQ
jgi:ubiquinone/menaquinone biosynthesis C-methylase UbiE